MLIDNGDLLLLTSFREISDVQDDPADRFARLQSPMRVADAFKRNHAVDVSAQRATVDHVGDFVEYLDLSQPVAMIARDLRQADVDERDV